MQETLNALLDEAANEIVGAECHDRTAAREAKCQRRTVRFCRNVFGKMPRRKRAEVNEMLKAVHVQESHEASEAKASEVADSLESMKLDAGAKVAREGCAETLAYTDFLMRHRARIRADNAIERSIGRSAAEPASPAPFPTTGPRSCW